VDLGVHLPLMALDDEPLSFARLTRTVDAARAHGYAAVSANDHFVMPRPWLDGPTALASVIERSGELALATTVALAVLRHPVPLAKTLEALDLLSGGRLIAAVAPGSSRHDYELLGIPFEERWRRFDAALVTLREQLTIPLWIGSWGSPAGLARVRRHGDGWLASAYNITPERLAAERSELRCALATMWTWVARDRNDAERALERLGRAVGRTPDELRERVCVGSPEHCAQLLARYAQAGCERVCVWPLGDEPRQLELLATARSESSIADTDAPR
jgi:alkanesulfonate monooxygenase SsuD/methylene tetrahydromethanopterin reductase-like flavin-dependent oxidoreductase (luciferase family)